jgi:hypothetical protein
MAIRTRIDPGGVAGAVRQTEAAVLKSVPIVRMMGMSEQIDSSIVPQRLFATLSAGLGALGALLAVIGLSACSRTRSCGAHTRSAFAWRSVRQRLTLCA